jgi:hypothetical protein
MWFSTYCYYVLKFSTIKIFPGRVFRNFYNSSGFEISTAFLNILNEVLVRKLFFYATLEKGGRFYVKDSCLHA